MSGVVGATAAERVRVEVPDFNPALRIVPSEPELNQDVRPLNEELRKAAFPRVTAIEPVVRPPSQGTHLDQALNHLRRQELKTILRHGGLENHSKILPFRFRSDYAAEASGLEGFRFTLMKFIEQFGQEASVAMLPHYFKYVRATLAGISGTKQAREKLAEIERAKASQEEKHDRFIQFICEYTEALRAEISRLDPAQACHQLRTYQVFVRSANLAGMREAFGEPVRPLSGKFFQDFDNLDFYHLATHGINCLRILGGYRLGVINAKGQAGGSPYAIKSYDIDPQYGSEQDVRDFCARAEKHGIRVLSELVCNHTAVDADLVEANPRLFIHTTTKPDDLSGYYYYKSEKHGELWIRHGGFRNGDKREFWTDTLQLDLSNPAGRDILVAQALDLIKRYGVHVIRVDSAYQLLNPYLQHNWNGEMQNHLPEEEFLSRLITKVKMIYPETIFVAEAFDMFDELSECGFDLVYGMNDMTRVGGHTHRGMYDALTSRDPVRIREALLRAEFLFWQKGGASMLTFWGQHDRPAPWHTFGDWKWGAAMLTLCKPGALNVYAGVEAQFESPCESDSKMITFEKPVQIDWRGVGSDFGKYQLNLLSLYENLRRRWGDMRFEALKPAVRDAKWVGYMIQPIDSSRLGDKVLVLANPTPSSTEVLIDRADLGIRNLRLTLGPCGPEGQEIIWIDGSKQTAPA